MSNQIDLQGSISGFFTKLKDTFAAIIHTHTVSDITDLLIVDNLNTTTGVLSANLGQILNSSILELNDKITSVYLIGLPEAALNVTDNTSYLTWHNDLIEKYATIKTWAGFCLFVSNNNVLFVINKGGKVITSTKVNVIGNQIIMSILDGSVLNTYTFSIDLTTLNSLNVIISDNIINNLDTTYLEGLEITGNVLSAEQGYVLKEMINAAKFNIGQTVINITGDTDYIEFYNLLGDITYYSYAWSDGLTNINIDYNGTVYNIEDVPQITTFTRDKLIINFEKSETSNDSESITLLYRRS